MRTNNKNDQFSRGKSQPRKGLGNRLQTRAEGINDSYFQQYKKNLVSAYAIEIR